MAQNNKPRRAVQKNHQDVATPQSEYITLQQLATWLSISRTTAWSIVIEREDIAYVRLADRVVRIARKDVEDYLLRCRSKTLSGPE